MNGEDRRLIGRWGEELVATDLRRKGCRVLAANWQCRMGEIDLIVSDGAYIRFVEVKLRKDSNFAAPREFVDRRKQEKLKVTAQLYLAQHETSLQPRFDVAEVYAPLGTKTLKPRIVYVENAF